MSSSLDSLKSYLGWSLHRLPSLRSAHVTLAIAVALALSACAPTVTRHGHHFQETDLQLVQPGMSQQQVSTSLGTPTTTATVGAGTAYYYISSTQSQKAFFASEETDRKVFAVYFTQQGSVDRAVQYGLKDGKVIDLAKRTTPSQARDESILKALFRNLGTKQLGLE